MLFFAWSLILSSVQYARRKRLLQILRSYMLSPFASRSALICRHLSSRFKQTSGYNQLFFDQHKKLVKAPSEPILNDEHAYETVLYHTEDIEILSSPFLSFKIDEWIPAFNSKNHLLINNKDERVFFVIKTSPLLSPTNHNDSNKPSTSNYLEVKTTGSNAENRRNDSQFYLVDELANRIACKKHCRDEEMLYETSLDNFYMIVIYWSESTLRALQGNFEIVEMNSIRAIDIELIRNAIEDCASSSSSLAAYSLYSSFASLNADKNLRAFSDRRTSRPFSLLELLYEQDREVHTTWNITNVYKNTFYSTHPQNPNLFASDTALNSSPNEGFSNLYDNLARRSYRKTKSASSRPMDNMTRYRSCSPSINPSLSTSSSLKRRPITAKMSADFSSRFSSPPSVPIYIQRRRKHYDSEPSSSSDASVIIPEIDLNAQVSRSSTFASNDEIKDLPKYEEREELFELRNMTTNDNPQPIPTLPALELTVNNNQLTESLSVDQNSNNYSSQQTDSPRDQILPLRSTFLDLFHKPINRLYNFKSNFLTNNRSKQPKQEMELPHAESQNHFLEISTEHFNPRRRHSLTPELKFSTETFGVQFEHCHRRRSLSPLSLSLLANFGSKDAINSIGNLQIGFQTTDALFQRCSITPRRRTHSMSSNGTAQNGNGVHKEQNGTLNQLEKPKAKPPSILIYTGDRNDQFQHIANSLQQILPRDTYTLAHLSTTSLRSHPWLDENTVCLLIADTKLLDDQAWIKLQSYFVYSGKILFVCQNSLVSNLTNCDSIKKQINLIKNAFGKKASNGALGKDFEIFMKKALKTLNKSKEVNETFHAKDPIGGYKFSVVLYKKLEQPLMLYMENSEHKASALFSDATTDQLLSAAGQQLIAEAMSRLGVQIRHNEPLPRLTRGYMVCQDDQLVFEMEGLTYGEELGNAPKFVFRPTIQLEDESLPNADNTLLPVEVRRRKTGIPNDTFNTFLYFDRLQTKSLGRAFLFVPVCDTTIKICKSLNQVLPNFDGIVVNAELQRAAVGRNGNQWLSPKGSIAFSFDFNVPLNSELGKNIVFIQHILAVSIVDAVLSLLKLPNFPLRIKWPNDIYFERKYKMGGILVTASSDNAFMRCIISAGLNVANSNPTVCLNDMLPVDHPQLTVEETLAEIMNKFEYHVNVFVNQGKKSFLQTYEKYWLHSREEVTVIHEENGVKDKVVIRGLDPSGYLEVRSKTSGKLFTVMDDGNTFDMLKGLIRPKK